MGSSGKIILARDRLILFDGVCNLCNGAVQFIIKRDRNKNFSFASLQSQTAKQLLRDSSYPSKGISTILVVKGDVIYDRSDAVIEICRGLIIPWRFLTVFQILPKAFRNLMYDFVARNRYRWFGKQDSCMLPTAELKARFIE